MTEDHKTILVVEDSPVQALALRQALEREGLQVLWAPNGRVGVDLAQKHLPDAILLDIEMPEMDGFEACRQLKADAWTAKIPVIMLTVHTLPAVVAGLLGQGAIDFIPKDVFSEATLLETLRQLHILDST
jgi:CheY-like chemotaxis protein